MHAGNVLEVVVIRKRLSTTCCESRIGRFSNVNGLDITGGGQRMKPAFFSEKGVQCRIALL